MNLFGKGNNELPNFSLTAPAPPVPLDQLPMQEMTIVYMRGDNVATKVIKGKHLYYSGTGFFNSPTSTYVPHELTNIFGNRDGREPLFTIATKHIITIETITIREG